MSREPATLITTHLRTLPLAHVTLAAPARAARWLRNAASIGVTPPLHLVHDLGALLTMPRPRQTIARPPHLPVDIITDSYLAFLDALAAHPLLRTLPTWRLNDGVVGVILARLVAGVTFPPAYTWPSGAGGLALAHDLAEQLAHAEPAQIWRTTPAAARPTLAQLLPPAALAQIQANARNLDEGELRTLHHYGPRLPSAPDPRTLLELLHLLNLPPHLRLTLSQVLRLAPHLSQQSRPSGAQTYAIGGYAGLTHKGSLDSLLPSELAYGDELFAHRLLNQEALYYGREAEQEHGQAVAYLVTQAGVELKGDPALLAQAATLALAQGLQRRGYTVQHSFVGSRWTPPSDLSQPAALHHLLAYQDEGWLDPAAMLSAIQRQLTAWRSHYRTRQLFWVVGYHWDADEWRQHLPYYRALAQEAAPTVWFIRGQPGPAKELPAVARHLGRAQLLDCALLWTKHTPPPVAPLPPPPLPPPQPAWQQWRDEIEQLGFRDGHHDVLHFANDERQLAAWQKLAVLDHDPHQIAIDEYLRSLAPENMVYIPAGKFLMGSTDDDPDAQENEPPQHEVELPGYYIDRYPVTTEQYQDFIEAGGYNRQRYWMPEGWKIKERDKLSEPHHWRDNEFNVANKPVIGVNWYEAMAYASWVGKQLPSEAQWEKAASWDPVTETKRRYPWGDTWDPERCNVQEGRIYGTTPVDQYSSKGDSAYGVSDLGGNVNEWCSSLSNFSYPYDIDSQPLSIEDSSSRALRGGSWNDQGEHTWSRCSFRAGMYPETWNVDRGFRCVWSYRVSEIQ